MMKIRKPILNALFLVFSCLPGAALADTVTLADLSDPTAQGDWRVFTDQVMGGRSEGRATIGDGALHMTGTVSTANGGGFIQARLEPVSLPEDASRIAARVRGDGQVYYLHLRTRGTRLPWQYYQAPFVAAKDWSQITLPLDSFTPSGPLMRATPAAGSVTSIGLVAYGRDHAADVSLSWLGAE